MLIHGLIAHSSVNGPGMRAVVYVQGCNLGCVGCWNPTTHAFRGPTRRAADLAGQVIAASGLHPLEGVTFSGGEPMQQASDLLEVIRLLKRAQPSLSIGMYSGYNERELENGQFWSDQGLPQEEKRQLWANIKHHLDFAVLGRFIATRPSRLPLRTSANQVLRLFGHRYREEHFSPLEFEVHIESQGLTQITGFPLAGLPH
jgi:anaerobic ribonucleoside-triphosphate reductase activating protein